MSKLYLVERTDSVGYDEYDSFVVLAKSPGEARNLCGEEAADEGRQIWTKANTTVIGIPHPLLKKDSRVILGSFNAG